MKRSLAPVFVAGLASFIACGRPTARVEPPPASNDAHGEKPSSPQEVASSRAPRSKGAPTTTSDLLLSDIEGMRRLDGAGYDLGSLLGDAASKTNAELAAGPRYTDLVRLLEEDVASAKAADSGSGVGMAFGHRLFDARYLKDADARWELIGVSARFDRDTFQPGHCGELRFIYRLAYEKSIRGMKIASRLPATAAISFWNVVPLSNAPPGERCVDALEAFRRGTVDRKHLQLERPKALQARFKAVELNVQIVRWPSTTRGDMAGHAEYALRALKKTADGAHLYAGPLENTPDVERTRREPAFREKLKAWLLDPAHGAAIDRGRAVLPDEFLAKKATSVTPLGLGRTKNRPFATIFRDRDLASFSFASGSAVQVRSPSALLLRLDGLSCQGCHASRSVAGFHFLGEETRELESVNAILVGRSPHLVADLERRVVDVPNGETTDAVRLGEERVVPFPERPYAQMIDEHRAAKRGERCGIPRKDGSVDPTFTTWKCESGLLCTSDPTSELLGIGTCLAKDVAVGDPCEVGVISASEDPHRDRVGHMQSRRCPPSAVCETNQVGFPSGTCAAGCSGLSKDETCGAIPFLVGFNNCLGKGNGVSFEDCIRANARPAGVQACDEARPCRDDYICARTPQGKGACMPPYFLFQLRVDGHP